MCDFKASTSPPATSRPLQRTIVTFPTSRVSNESFIPPLRTRRTTAPSNGWRDYKGSYPMSRGDTPSSGRHYPARRSFCGVPSLVGGLAATFSRRVLGCVRPSRESHSEAAEGSTPGDHHPDVVKSAAAPALSQSSRIRSSRRRVGISDKCATKQAELGLWQKLG